MVNHTYDNVGKDIVTWYIEELERQGAVTPEEIRLWIRPGTFIASAMLLPQCVVFKMGTRVFGVIYKEVYVDFKGVMSRFPVGGWYIDSRKFFTTFGEALTEVRTLLNSTQELLTDDPAYKKFINKNEVGFK